MKHLKQYYGLIFASFGAIAGAFTANANIKTNTDELYSESIYIHKSTAEVPGAFESSGKEDPVVSTIIAEAPEEPMESMADLESAPAPKKISQASRSKKNRH